MIDWLIFWLFYWLLFEHFRATGLFGPLWYKPVPFFNSELFDSQKFLIAYFNEFKHLCIFWIYPYSVFVIWDIISCTIYYCRNLEKLGILWSSLQAYYISVISSVISCAIIELYLWRRVNLLLWTSCFTILHIWEVLKHFDT